MALLRSIDLFSGIGGISYALRPYVRPIAYCEIDRYCQSLLLECQASGQLDAAPIWDDVRTFDGSPFKGRCDIICGGFPCQDISVAGRGIGLEGERSGLFFEILRLAKEIQPAFLFLENVPAITTRGGLRVVREIAEIGYDSRWCTLSAQQCGALHKRERWWLLAFNASLCGEMSVGKVSRGDAADSDSGGFKKRNSWSFKCDEERNGTFLSNFHDIWQNTEPPVCGIPHGVPNRVDRIRGLGNAVVPQCAEAAFRYLMGYTLS